MANIIVSTRCNRSCPYCFAQSEMAQGGQATFMSWDDLIYLADMHAASAQKSISLLGGEPTLHPDIVDLIIYLLQRDFSVTVFTNGIMSERKLTEFRHHLTKFDARQLSFVCNLNDPEKTPAPKEHQRKIERFLALMGPWTMPGFNIYRIDFSLDFLFDLINRFGMKRHMRLGITHPIPGRPGGFIPPEDIRIAIERFLSYRSHFDALRVSPGIDCGFPLCKFTDDEIGWLHHFSRPVQFRCATGLDITPGMDVYYCFPLSRYERRSVFDFDSMSEMRNHFQKVADEIRQEIPGIYEECDGCRYRQEGVCSAGGLCQVLNRLVPEARVRGKEIDRGLSGYNLP